MKKLSLTLAVVFSFLGCAHNSKISSSINILSVQDVKWEKLNPARGDKSPQAGTLWGNRKGSPETGFLAKFVDGFSSPPHIHNVSYRAIVIKGLVHNDDPKAATMWMPKGSYWTQPAGESHITSAKGKSNIALVEIDHGPYLVKPIQQKFDNGERPYNIHASNIIWSDKGNYHSVNLWKNKKGIITGSLFKFSGSLNIDSTNSKIVVISGRVFTQKYSLDPGSLITVDDNSVLNTSCEVTECIIYLKTNKKFRIF